MPPSTLLPTLMALPTISWPTTIGYGVSPQPLRKVWRSEAQIPQHSISMSTSVSSQDLMGYWPHFN